MHQIPTKRYGRNLFFFEEIDSTNACALTLAETGAEEGTVVWADYQTAGRGRRGRVWVGDPGKNLSFSVVLRDLPWARWTFLPYYVSESVAGAVEKLTGLDVTAKWPNDLLVESRKFCGILIEGNGQESNAFAVAGIGMNVNQTDFPDHLSHAATSLARATGSTADRVSIYHAVLVTLERLLEEVRTNGDTAVLDAWKDRCTTIGQDVSVRYGDESFRGKAIGLSDDGGLIVETADGLRTVFAGDVTLAA